MAVCPLLAYRHQAMTRDGGRQQSFCSYPAGEYSGEDRREATKRKFGQVWLPTQVIGLGPFIASHKSPWPNGQGVGPLIRRLWVRVPQGMQFYVARTVTMRRPALPLPQSHAIPPHLPSLCPGPHPPPLPQVGSLDRVSADGQRLAARSEFFSSCDLFRALLRCSMLIVNLDACETSCS